MEYNVETIEQAIYKFYHGAQSHQETNQYLFIAQISPDAWKFLWQLLDHSKPVEVQFFGASTMCMKISKFLHEVPPDQYGPLRQQLLEIILHYSKGPKIVLTRLCVAFTSYILQTISNHWPTAISDIIASFHPSTIPHISPIQLRNVLLELLTVIPEEFQTAQLPSSEKGVVRNILHSNVLQVFSLLQDVLNSPEAEHHMALKCYSSWAQLGPGVFEWDSLLLATLNAVYQEELSQTALEALSNVITHPEAHKYSNFIMKLLPHLLKLENLLAKAIEENDMDLCSSIYSLFICVAEVHTHILLSKVLEKQEDREIILKLVAIILKCSGTPGQFPIDETCSQQAFGFWYTLQDDIMSSDPKRFEALLLVFHPSFQSLVDAYLVKVRLPPDHVYQQWHSDEKEVFRCYRQDIGDSFMYCYNILRETMLASLMAHLSYALGLANKDSSQWQYLEAVLYGFHSVAENVGLQEHKYLPQFFATLPTIPLNHSQLAATSMDVVGAYAEWINNHQEILNHVIPFLLLGLQNVDVAPSATMALKDITRDCQIALIPFSEQILFSSQQALGSNILKSRERIRLMSSIGQVLSTMPLDFVMPYLSQILTPVLHQIQQAVPEHTPNGKATIILNLNLLSMLFATLDMKPKQDDSDGPPPMERTQAAQPVMFILQQILPLLANVTLHWATDENVTETICDCLKKAVCTLLDDCKPLLNEILQLNLQIYKSCTQAPPLDLAKQIMLIFGQDDELKPQISCLLGELCNCTLELCQKDLRENTATVEIFFQMMSQIIKKLPVYMNCECVNTLALFQCGVASLSLPEKPTIKASSSFLAEFVNLSREVPSMLDTVNNHGEALVGQILKIIGGEAPRTVVEHMPDILMALSKKYFDNLCRWMTAYLQQEGFPSPKVTKAQKENFTRHILKERTNKRKMKEIVTEFSLISRGIIGTEYANVTVALP